ncbi:YdcF family protein [Marilutibacter chinensis]|uniref:YdcF family protein n=1 Tax=Marilutibacter chinensis TaxID=2912247 RepID=A0ABS9HSA2_9GAMM|nr:YdcF family protein [Lysobacter chinensis]MCF7220942.1 YdcF family protein [Lysobacter chinensis]
MWMLSPLSWLLVALAGACLCARSHARWARRLLRVCVAVAGLAVLATTPLVANLLVGALEAPARGVSAVCRDAAADVAVVLAGAVDGASGDADGFSALGLTSRRRVEAAVDWWRAAPGRVLVMSGGPQQAADGGGDTSRPVAAAMLMARYARRLGVAAEALRVEDGSTTTRDNARRLARLRPALPRDVVLVTSAMHVPRARYAMARAGFDACPLASDYRQVPFALPGSLIPRASALVKTEDALHEWVGMVYYRWLDWRQHHGDGAQSRGRASIAPMSGVPSRALPE